MHLNLLEVPTSKRDHTGQTIRPMVKNIKKKKKEEEKSQEKNYFAVAGIRTHKLCF